MEIAVLRFDGVLADRFFVFQYRLGVLKLLQLKVRYESEK